MQVQWGSVLFVHVLDQTQDLLFVKLWDIFYTTSLRPTFFYRSPTECIHLILFVSAHKGRPESARVRVPRTTTETEGYGEASGVQKKLLSGVFAKMSSTSEKKISVENTFSNCGYRWANYQKDSIFVIFLEILLNAIVEKNVYLKSSKCVPKIQIFEVRLERLTRRGAVRKVYIFGESTFWLVESKCDKREAQFAKWNSLCIFPWVVFFMFFSARAIPVSNAKASSSTSTKRNLLSWYEWWELLEKQP